MKKAGTNVGEKVLLVDDDEKLLRLLREYLEEYGFQVHTLANGSTVVQTLREESTDMMILDIMLPKKDGLEVLREIRKEFSLPVIMLTAKGEDADRILGLELGADDYLPKPFNPRELLARMKAVMRRLGPRDKAEAGEEKALCIEAGGLVKTFQGNIPKAATSDPKTMGRDPVHFKLRRHRNKRSALHTALPIEIGTRKSQGSRQAPRHHT